MLKLLFALSSFNLFLWQTHQTYKQDIMQKELNGSYSVLVHKHKILK